MAALSILIWKGFLIPFILLLLLVEVNFRFYSFTYNPVWVTWLDYNFFWKKDQWYSIHEIVSSSQQIAYILIKLLLKSSLPYFVSIQNSCWESKKSRKSMKPVIYSYGTELILLAILFFFFKQVITYIINFKSLQTAKKKKVGLLLNHNITPSSFRISNWWPLLCIFIMKNEKKKKRISSRKSGTLLRVLLQSAPDLKTIIQQIMII